MSTLQPEHSLVIFGARDIEVITPYPARAMWLDKHTTYLDTIGRPAIMFEYKDLTIKHAQNVYVSFSPCYTTFSL
jgi:oligosaccharyltransferase complex subunit alpha (ribophorin I)